VGLWVELNAGSLLAFKARAVRNTVTSLICCRKAKVRMKQIYGRKTERGNDWQNA
jgi:hypothetical protein